MQCAAQACSWFERTEKSYLQRSLNDNVHYLEYVVDARRPLLPSNVTTSNPTLSVPCLTSPTQSVAMNYNHHFFNTHNITQGWNIRNFSNKINQRKNGC